MHVCSGTAGTATSESSKGAVSTPSTSCSTRCDASTPWEARLVRAEPAADAVLDAAVWKVYVREGVLVEAGDWWTSAEAMDGALGLDLRVVVCDDGFAGDGCAGRCRKIC